VALDDLHVAGVGSALLLQFVDRHSRRSPIVLIGTYRDVEVRLDAELAPVMRDLESVAVRLELAPFDHAQVEQLLAGSVPDLTDELVAEVVERTQGNPLFVAQIAREGGRTAHAPIPPGLRQAIRRR